MESCRRTCCPVSSIWRASATSLDDVHDYVRVDDAIVYGILKKHLGDFEAFARAVTAYLRRSRTSSP
ncbi:HepT-like ribonuclease domain-containing protein [Thermoflexus hugenholtzii]